MRWRLESLARIAQRSAHPAARSASRRELEPRRNDVSSHAGHASLGGLPPAGAAAD